MGEGEIVKEEIEKLGHNLNFRTFGLILKKHSKLTIYAILTPLRKHPNIRNINTSQSLDTRSLPNTRTTWGAVLKRIFRQTGIWDDCVNLFASSLYIVYIDIKLVFGYSYLISFKVKTTKIYSSIGLRILTCHVTK